MYRFPEELKKAYEASPLSFVYYENSDGQAMPVLASDGFCDNVGMERDEALRWLRVGMFERMHPDDVGIMRQISDDFLNKRGPYDVVFRCRISSGSEGSQKYVQMHGLGKWQTMPDGTQLAVITYANLSHTTAVTLEQLAAYSLFQRDRFYSDPLTGLPNKNYLLEYGTEKINTIRADGQTPYVIYTDIYSMQSYNNQYGFSEGNDLICLVADTMKKLFPKALVARGSDDHFIIIAPFDDRSAVEAKLFEVNEIIRSRAKGNTSGIRSGVCPVGSSVAISAAIDHAKHALRRIDNNLNREVAFFSQEADNIYWRSRYIVENFAAAMENGWIKVFYHSLHRIESQKIAAFEGLARWVDPNRGIISPADFIPVLLKYHQLYKLDLYMFEQVCRELSIRQKNGLPLMPVSVNFSRQDFDHADVVGEMNRLYDKYGLADTVDKSYFIVEITEQDLALGAERLREQLSRIRENGYRLWLDDFGSGYSALNVFSRFDFDLIKFDMDLLRHLDDNGRVNRLILKEFVYIAHELGIHTLIEGVETEEQLDFVREIGCELAQGFYFHRPESLDEILFRIKNGDLIRSCETPEERSKYDLKWLKTACRHKSNI